MKAFLCLLLAGLLSSAVVAAPARAPGDQARVRVIVLSYDPVLSGQGGARLSEHMGWHDPRKMTREFVQSIRQASGDFLVYEVVDYVTVDAFPEKRDGFRYDEESFLAMWADRSLAHQPDTVSYAAIFREHNLAERIKSENIGEIWLWGAPYFGWDEYAMKIPGDRLFYPTENPWFYRPYDIPDLGRTVWVMGFSYERGLAEALHSYGHRIEGILSLTVGRGVWDHEKTPENIWNRFTRQAAQFPHDAQVGNVHGGPNAEKGYDYANPRAVLSAADDWLRYPHLTGRRTLVSAESWGGPDYHLNYMKWWLARLPKAPGATAGFHDNWWRYIADYDRALRALPPPGGRLHRLERAMR